MKPLFGKTIDLLSAMLDFRSERHKVIISNIANIDTPNYRPKDIVFKEKLKEMFEDGEGMRATENRESHLSGHDRTDEKSFEVVDVGERVDLDGEMAKLAENNLMYNLSVELLARKFKGLDTVLREAK